MAKSGGRTVKFETGQGRDVLMSLVDQLGTHIEAIHEIGSQLLSAADGATTRSLEVTVRVELGDLSGPAESRPEVATFGAGPASECYTARYICGKGPNGYIWCERDVCIEVEPVQVLPG